MKKTFLTFVFSFISFLFISAQDANLIAGNDGDVNIKSGDAWNDMYAGDVNINVGGNAYEGGSINISSISNSYYQGGITFESHGLVKYNLKSVIQINNTNSNNNRRLLLDPRNGFFSANNSTGTPTLKLSSQGDSYFLGGNVGVGVTNPNYELDVSGDVHINGDLYHNNQLVSLSEISTPWANNGSNIVYNGNVGIGAVPGWNTTIHIQPNSSRDNLVILERNNKTNQNYLSYVSTELSASSPNWCLGTRGNSSDYEIYTYSGHTKTRFMIDTEGKVGINTRDPQYMLDVNGGFRCSNDAIFTEIGIGTTSNPNSKLSIKSGWGEWIHFENTANSGYYGIHNGQSQDGWNLFYRDSNGNYKFNPT